MKVKVGVVTVTPAKALRMLEEHNTHNRDVDSRRIDQYAADMLAGTWEVNGEAIKIADDGVLLDGQHRLWACIDCGKSFQTIIVTGLSRKSQESMDQGRARGFHDVLKLRGEPDPNVLARAVRVLTVYEDTGVPFLGGWKRAPTNHECSRTLEHNPEIRDACKWANRWRTKKGQLLPTSLIGVLHFLFSAVDEQGSEEFFDALAGRRVDAADSILLLRRVLLDDLGDSESKAREQRIHLRIKTAYVVLTWNAWRNCAELDELSWARDEDFPSIHGLASKVVNDGLFIK